MKTKTVILITIGIVFIIIAVALLISWLIYRHDTRYSKIAGGAMIYMSDDDKQLLRFLYGAVNFKYILRIRNGKMHASFTSRNSFDGFMKELLSYNLDATYLGGIHWSIMKKILDSMPNSLKNA